jgi:hypothetical protein
LTVDDYSNISTLWLENAGVADEASKQIVCDISDNARVRLLNIDWEMEGAAEFKEVFDKVNTYRGLDEQGGNMNVAQLTGAVHTSSAYKSYLRVLKNRFPYVTFTADELTSLVKAYVEGTLEVYEDNVATSIRASSFRDIKNLQTVVLENVTTIGSQSFDGCTNLKNVYLPKLTTLNYRVFYNCSNLKYIELPSLVTISSTDHFCSNYALEWADMGNADSLRGNMFSNCRIMKRLFLRKENSICTNTDKNIFTNTPFKGYNNLIGFAYVPSALISTYEAATNWAALYNAGTCFFKPLEDYTKDGTVTGELDWDAINVEEV